jgi:hypothetical protein
MSALILIASAILWAVAHTKSSEKLSRGAAVVQLLGFLVTLVERSDLPPAGWASVGVAMMTLPTLVAIVRPGHAFVTAMRAPFVICALCAAVWSVAIAGPGVPTWDGAMIWPELHIIVAIIAMGALTAVALLALHHLRGRLIGLLLAALVITLLPLFGPKAATVALYQDGEVAIVVARISSGEGDVGITRELVARAPLPGDEWIRYACLSALFLALSMALLQHFSGRKSQRNWVHWLAITTVSVQVLALFGSATQRPIFDDKERVVEVARNTLILELAHGESVSKVTVADGPFTGGRGSPANTLPLALMALGSVLAAVFPRRGESVLGPLERQMVYGAILALSLTIATGIAWSNISWGGPIIGDPKLYAALVALLCLFLYLQVAAPGKARSPSASWFILAAFFVLLLSMLGPELGWTTPSLHHFGA